MSQESLSSQKLFELLRDVFEAGSKDSPDSKAISVALHQSRQALLIENSHDMEDPLLRRIVATIEVAEAQTMRLHALASNYARIVEENRDLRHRLNLHGARCVHE